MHNHLSGGRASIWETIKHTRTLIVKSTVHFQACSDPLDWNKKTKGQPLKENKQDSRKVHPTRAIQ